MVKIRKNEVELVVSKGAFDNLYARMGFKIVDASKPEKVETTKVETPNEEIKKVELEDSKKESKKSYK